MSCFYLQREYSEAASKSASNTMDTYVESSPAALGSVRKAD